MAFFNKVQTIKMDYMQLTNVFDRLLLVPEYMPMWDDFIKKINRAYFGSVTNTSDGKYTFYMGTTSVYFFPYMKKYIWIRDNNQKVVYELDKPSKYKLFKKSAVNAIVNKKINMQTNGYQNPNQNMQMNGYQAPNQNMQTNGYQNPEQNMQTNGYQNPEQSMQMNGYQNPEQNMQMNGYQNQNQNMQMNGYQNQNQNMQPNGYQNTEQNI